MMEQLRILAVPLYQSSGNDKMQQNDRGCRNKWASSKALINISFAFFKRRLKKFLSIPADVVSR